MNILKFTKNASSFLLLTYIIQNEKTTQNLWWFGSNSKKEEEEDTYQWGNAYYQARPELLKQFRNLVPKQIVGYVQDNKLNEKFPAFYQVKYNSKNGFGIDANGNLFQFQNRQVPSYWEQVPENIYYTKDKKISKDKLLNDFKKMNIANVQQIALTDNFLWVLNKQGNLFSCNLNKLLQEKQETFRKVPTIDNLQDIQAGQNHILMLKKDGQLYSMGDDTYGQCGQGSFSRPQQGPFVYSKIPNPGKVVSFNNTKIKKIFAKGNFSYVITENDEVYAFGSNSHLQLANEESYAQKNSKLAYFEPISMMNYLSSVNCQIQDIALGNEFALFSCINSGNQQSELYGCGKNLNGQLGNGFIKHINDFQKIEQLSNYTFPKEDGSKGNVRIDHLQCGSDHCLAYMNVGALMTWGANEYGQLGNKKRAFSEKPLLHSKFKSKKVNRIFADYYNSYVVTQRDENIKKETNIQDEPIKTENKQQFLCIKKTKIKTSLLIFICC